MLLTIDRQVFLSASHPSTMPAIFKLPLFTFMLKDGTGAVFLLAGQSYWLPLFTSADYAAAFCHRARMRVSIAQLATWKAVLDYVSNPPSRSPDVSIPCDRIVVDPIDLTDGDWQLFDRITFLATVKAKVGKGG